jgi:hypothetical protein
LAAARICPIGIGPHIREEALQSCPHAGRGRAGPYSLVVAADSGGAVAALTVPPGAGVCLPAGSDVRIRIQGADRRVVVTLPVRSPASRSFGDPAAALIDRLDGPHPEERGSGSAGLLALVTNRRHVRPLVRLR